MARQQFFANLQKRLATRAMWGWTALLDEIQQVKIPAQFDIPEPYKWCSGTIAVNL